MSGRRLSVTWPALKRVVKLLRQKDHLCPFSCLMVRGTVMLTLLSTATEF